MSNRGIGSLLFRLGADIKDFESNLKTAERELKSFQYKAQRIGRDLSTSITLPLAAIGAKSVMAFDQQAKAIAQVEAGIKSTGGAAGLTSQQLQNMAADLQKITTFGDEDILKNVSAQLLTFTNVTKNEFPRAQKAILDISARMGSDLKSASIMVGKALNDPIQGLTALRRVGIQFTDDQEKVIKSLVETGNMAEAQQQILVELERQFGGSAEAMVQGLGSVQQMWNAIGDASEEVGKILVPYLEKMAGRVKNLAEGFAELDEDTQRFIITAAAIAASVGPGLLAINQLIKVKAALATTAKLLEASIVKLNAAFLKNPYTAVLVALTAITTALVLYNRRKQEQSELEQSYQRIQASVNKEVDLQAAKISALTRIIENGNIPLEQRRKAIEDLKKIVPEYNAQLDEEGRLINNNKLALEDYVKALKQKILINAIEGEITDLIQKQTEAVRNLSDAQAELDQKQKRAQETGATLGLGKAAQEVINYQRTIQETEAAIQKLSDELTEAGKGLDLFGSNFQTTTPVLAEAEGAIGGLTDEIQEQVRAVDILSDSWRAFVNFVKANSSMDLSSISAGRMTGIQSQGLQTDQVILPEKKQYAFGLQPLVRGNKEAADRIIADWQRLQESAKAISDNIAASFANIATTFASSLGQMAAGQMTFIQGLRNILTAFGDAMQQLGTLFVSAGVAASNFWASLTNPASAPMAIVGGLALIAAGAGVKAFANSGFKIPGMLDGGIVPQGFPNDSYLARLTSGETVLPPKKLDELMNKVGKGGSGVDRLVVEVVGKLKGSDILFAGEVARASRKRNIGR